MKDKFYDLFRTIIIFVCYMFYASVFNILFQFIGIDNGLISMLIGDIVFFVGIVFIYKETLKKDWNIFKKEYSIKNKIWTIVKWILIILVVNIFMGILTEIFYPELASGVDQNTSAVKQLFDASFLYSLFKTLIFAPIAEELLFKKSIRDVVKHDVAFIIISSFIYTAMNFMYASGNIQYVDILGYFLFSLILSLAYIKNKDNMIVVIFIKLIYNLFPTILLIITMLAGATI